MKNKLKRLKELFNVTKELVVDEIQDIFFKKELTSKEKDLLRALLSDTEDIQVFGPESEPKTKSVEPAYKLGITPYGVEFTALGEDSLVDSIFIPLTLEELRLSSKSIFNLVDIYVNKSNFPFQPTNLKKLSKFVDKQGEVDVVADLLMKMINFKNTVNYFKRMNSLLKDKVSKEIKLRELPIEREN